MKNNNYWLPLFLTKVMMICAGAIIAGTIITSENPIRLIVGVIHCLGALSLVVIPMEIVALITINKR